MTFQSVKSILSGTDIQAKIDARIAQDEQKRQHGVSTYGWRESCDCVECGDTGRHPESGDVCWCDAGREEQTKSDREKYWESLVPEGQRHFRINKHPNRDLARSVYDWMMEMPLDKPSGPNLILTGPVGTGKTGLALAVMRAFVMAGTRCMYGTTPRILDALRPVPSSVVEEVTALRTSIDRVCNVPVLVLDDLGTEKKGEWPAERLTTIFDERHKRNKPTIITTNLKPEQFIGAVGERITSRMTSGATILYAGGKDLRQSGMKI